MPVPNSTLSPKAVNGTLGFLVAGTLVNILASTIPYLHDHMSPSLRDEVTILIAAGIGLLASWKSKHRPTVSEIISAVEASIDIRNALETRTSGGAVVPSDTNTPRP